MTHTTAGTLVGTLASRTDMSRAIRIAAVFFVATLTAIAAQVSIHLPFS